MNEVRVWWAQIRGLPLHVKIAQLVAGVGMAALATGALMGEAGSSARLAAILAAVGVVLLGAGLVVIAVARKAAGSFDEPPQEWYRND